MTTAIHSANSDKALLESLSNQGVNHVLVQSTKADVGYSKKGVLQKFSWTEYGILVLAGMVGVLGDLPAAWGVMEKNAALSKVPVQLLAMGQLVQSTIWIFFTVGIALLLAAKIGLGAPILRGCLMGEQVGTKLRVQYCSTRSMQPYLDIFIGRMVWKLR